MMKPTNAKDLLEKYNQGEATEQEAAIVENWYMTAEGTETPKAEALLEDQYESRRKLILYMNPEKKYRLWLPLTAAVAILMVIGVVFYNNGLPEKSGMVTSSVPALNDVAPGGNKAILTLSNGKKIELANAGIGKLAEQAGIEITKSEDGEIEYDITDPTATATGNNTIATPKGGQYTVNLPDGSKVILNAASTLTYPVNFMAAKHREVKLLGEAYFEISKDKDRTFTVETNKQKVEVLGTHFNISSYPEDDNSATTTLLEGSIMISSGRYKRIITPGQQATLDRRGIISVKSVNAESVAAWKDGVFSFEKADLSTVMSQLSRWYDVEVYYQGNLPNISFTGKIYRNATLQEALKSIGYLDVKYQVVGQSVIIKN